MEVVSSGARGTFRAAGIWFTITTSISWLSAPYTAKYAERVRPEGGGFNFGGSTAASMASDLPR